MLATKASRPQSTLVCEHHPNIAALQLKEQEREGEDDTMRLIISQLQMSEKTAS